MSNFLHQFVRLNVLISFSASAVKWRFFEASPIMEAEQLNIIANRLTGLATRTTDLRRYL